MEYVSAKDYYELSLGSIISDVDIDVVIELYQPIIGYKALAVYLTLAKDGAKLDDEFISSHETLLNRMQLTPGEFNTSKSVLEAVGLLKTYFKEENQNRIFSYVIYSPKSPKSFFDDVLFKGLLVKYIGEKETSKLANKYRINILDTEESINISSSFTDVFNLDYDDNAFLAKINVDLTGREVGKYNTGFDFNVFFENIENKSQLTKSAFTKKQIKEIERIACLYAINEEIMAGLIIDSYDSTLDKEDRIDFNKVSINAQKENKFLFLQKKANGKRSEINSSSLLADKVKFMDQVSPYEFLRIKQNNTKPAPADMKIVDDISKNYCLNNGVINVLVDFVLTKKENKLVRSYIEKIAAQLARERIETAIDAMNYLNKSASSFQKKVTNQHSSTTSEEKTLSDEEIEKLINDMEN